MRSATFNRMRHVLALAFCMYGCVDHIRFGRSAHSHSCAHTVRYWKRIKINIKWKHTDSEEMVEIVLCERWNVINAHTHSHPPSYQLAVALTCSCDCSHELACKQKHAEHWPSQLVNDKCRNTYVNAPSAFTINRRIHSLIPSAPTLPYRLTAREQRTHIEE